jgi:hypothetical protein
MNANASAGMVYWDVFKAARLDAFKPKPIAASAEGEAAGANSLRTVGGSTKSSRLQHTTHSAGKMPPSFTSNNLKEQKILAYIADFQRIFRELYPYRCENQTVGDSCLCSVLWTATRPILCTAICKGFKNLGSNCTMCKYEVLQV